MILVLFLGRLLGLAPLPWASSFLLIVALIVLASLSWWAWVDRHLRGTTSETDRPGRRQWLRWAWTLFIVVMFSPMLFWMIGVRRIWDAYPVPLITWILVWHLLMVTTAAIWSPLAGIGAAIQRLRRRRQVPPTDDGGPKSSRRELLVRTAIAAPMIVTGVSCGLAVAQTGRFVVRRVTVRLPRLPARLEGLTITHISDMHVGRLFRREHLPRLVEAVSQLKSDIIAVTGDIVDHSMDFMPPACDALAQMEARYGRFVVLGNHDLMDSPGDTIEYVKGRERLLLIDRMLPLLIGGETVQMAGLFWSRYDGSRRRGPRPRRSRGHGLEQMPTCGDSRLHWPTIRTHSIRWPSMVWT